MGLFSKLGHAISGAVGGFISGGPAGAISGALGGLASDAQNSAMAQMQSKNYQLAYDQLHSAHQIEVADLKAAGLNPVLSANKGASTFNPGQYQPVNRQMQALQSAQMTAETQLASANAAKALSEARLNDRQRENIDVLENLQRAQTDHFLADIKVKDQYEQNLLADYKYRMKELEWYDPKASMTINLQLSEIARNYASGKMSEAMASYYIDRIANNAVERGLVSAQTGKVIAETGLVGIRSARENLEYKHQSADQFYTSEGYQTGKNLIDDALGVILPWRR